MRDDDWYKPHPHRRPAPPPQPKTGEEVWRLRGSDGRVQSCELRNNSRLGAGCDVMLLETLVGALPKCEKLLEGFPRFPGVAHDFASARQTEVGNRSPLWRAGRAGDSIAARISGSCTEFQSVPF
jgi:hypothetical protein